MADVRPEPPESERDDVPVDPAPAVPPVAPVARGAEKSGGEARSMTW